MNWKALILILFPWTLWSQSTTITKPTAKIQFSNEDSTKTVALTQGTKYPMRLTLGQDSLDLYIPHYTRLNSYIIQENKVLRNSYENAKQGVNIIEADFVKYKLAADTLVSSYKKRIETLETIRDLQHKVIESEHSNSLLYQNLYKNELKRTRKRESLNSFLYVIATALGVYTLTKL